MSESFGQRCDAVPGVFWALTGPGEGIVDGGGKTIHQ